MRSVFSLAETRQGRSRRAGGFMQCLSCPHNAPSWASAISQEIIGVVKPGLQDAPRAWNPKQRLRGPPTEQQRESKGRRELYAGGGGLIEEDELRPQNKDIMDEIDRVGAARE